MTQPAPLPPGVPDPHCSQCAYQHKRPAEGAAHRLTMFCNLHNDWCGTVRANDQQCGPTARDFEPRS
jgi:hypothetical protein